jgi:hypothetical protein
MIEGHILTGARSAASAEPSKREAGTPKLGLVERRGGGAAGVGGRGDGGGARTGDEGMVLAAGVVEWTNAGLWSVVPAGPGEHPEVSTVVFAADVETFAGVSTGGAAAAKAGADDGGAPEAEQPWPPPDPLPPLRPGEATDFVSGAGPGTRTT